MSNATPRAAAQPTITELEDAQAYLRERAPADPAAAYKIACAIHRPFIREEFSPHGFTIDPMAVMREMREHWNPRLPKPLDDDALFTVAEKLKDNFEAAHAKRLAEKAASRRAAAKDADKRRAERRAAEQAEKARRAANAEFVRAIMDRCAVSQRQAQRLLAGKTTKPDQAAILAEITGADAADYLRQPGHPGRNPDIVSALLRPYVYGANWRDFIADPPELEGEKAELRTAFTDAYRRGTMRNHIRDVEPVIRFARAAGVSADAAQDLWDMYKPWRLERVFEAAMDELGNLDDFG